MAILNPYNYQKPKSIVMTSPSMERFVPSAKNNCISQQDQYLEQKVLSAKPEELTLMLYEGMVRFIKVAQMNHAQKIIDKTSNALLRAQAIVTELQVTLDPQYEISAEFDRLYDFLKVKLTQANINKDEQAMEEALAIAIELRDTWKQAMSQV